MKPSYVLTRSLVLAGLAALGASFIACTVGGAPDSADPPDVGIAEMAITTINPTCTSMTSETRHSSEWPWHAAGACPATPAYTTGDAAVACGGGALNYFGYGCADFADGTHTWTAYFGCCTPAPLGADCSQDSQCQSGHCGPSIGFETRYYAQLSSPPPQSRDQAIALFESLPASYPHYGYSALTSTDSYSNHTLISGGDTTNFGSHLRATIQVNVKGSWRFRLGADYGLGGILLVDRQEPSHDQGKMTHYWSDPALGWNQQGINWGGTSFDPNDPNHPYLEGYIELSPGLHDVEAYGFENCCDGNMRLEVAAPGGPWLPISALSTKYCSP